MKVEKITKFVKAGVAILACIGITVTPENTDNIIKGAAAVVSILYGIEGIKK